MNSTQFDFWTWAGFIDSRQQVGMTARIQLKKRPQNRASYFCLFHTLNSEARLCSGLMQIKIRSFPSPDVSSSAETRPAHSPEFLGTPPRRGRRRGAIPGRRRRRPQVLRALHQPATWWADVHGAWAGNKTKRWGKMQTKFCNLKHTSSIYL